MEPQKRPLSKNNNNNNNKNKKTRKITTNVQLPGIPEENEDISSPPLIDFSKPFSDEQLVFLRNLIGEPVASGSFGRTERIYFYGRSLIKKISQITSKEELNVYKNEVYILSKNRGDPYFPFLYGHQLFKDSHGDTYGLLVMEDIVGLNLRQLVKSGRGILKSEEITLINLIKDALQHIHNKGFIHLDVKENNIIVRMHYNVIIGIVFIDYGVSKDARGPTKNLPIFFTEFYAQPELLKKHKEFTNTIATNPTFAKTAHSYNPNKHKAFEYKYSKKNNEHALGKTISRISQKYIKNNVDTPEALQIFNRPTQPRFNEYSIEESLTNCLNIVSTLFNNPNIPISDKKLVEEFANRIIAARHSAYLSYLTSSTTSTLTAQPDMSLHNLIKNKDFSFDEFKRLIGHGADTDTVNSDGKTVLDILNERIEEIEKSMQIAIVATAYNNRVPLIQKYTAARDFLEAGLIKVGGKRKTRKAKRS